MDNAAASARQKSYVLYLYLSSLFVFAYRSMMDMSKNKFSVGSFQSFKAKAAMVGGGGTAGTSSPIKIKNYTSKALGPVNHGYVRTLKGKLHMMSVAVSNKVAVSKRKLSHNV